MHTQIEADSKFYVSQGLKLHYLDWGNHGAPVLLLLHGMRDHARSWDWVARALRHDWHVIAPDLRGHGDSEWSVNGAYHSPYYLSDFCDLIEVLGEESVSIVAHSFGGNPAARFAALYPSRVEKLVLVDAMGPSEPVLSHWRDQGVINRTREWLEKSRRITSAQPKRYATIEAAIARMAEANQHLSGEQARHLAIHGARHHADGYGWKYDPRIGTILPEDFAIDLAEFWREITAPTLLCWGTESWTTNPATDGRAGHFRDHHSLTFEGAGHWLHHDQLEAFLEALSDFF
ncbi:MAG: alpha/beta hydrolase [Halioglobus sp.]|nr:alpha/beta hydrolase [Halioglobus sp.]